MPLITCRAFNAQMLSCTWLALAELRNAAGLSVAALLHAVATHYRSHTKVYAWGRRAYGGTWQMSFGAAFGIACAGALRVHGL